MSGLLVSLVAANGWAPEPVATAALVHLLQQPAAASAFGQWADSVTHGSGASTLRYSGQASGATGGRPDVVGSDASGARVVVEAKFAAALTTKQATDGGYSGHLAAGAPGLLVYLVPTDRVVAMWAAATAIHPGSTDDTPPGQMRRLVLLTGHSVTVLALVRPSRPAEHGTHRHLRRG